MRNPSRNLRIVQRCALSVVMLTVIVGCSGPASGPESDSSLPEGAESVTASVAPVPGSHDDDLRVVTRLDERRQGSASAEQSFIIDPSETSIAAVIDVERDFGWMAVTPTWLDTDTNTSEARSASSRATVGPLSTAVAILFANPAFHHPDPDAARVIVDTLRDLPEVHAFADEIERRADMPDPFEVPSVLSAFETAYSAGVDALGDAGEATASDPANDEASGLSTQDTSISIAEIDDDAVRFDADRSASTIRPSWSEQYKRVTGERTVTWVGRLYEIDEERVTRETVNRRFFDRWEADFPVRLDAPDRRVRLNAEYSQAALVLDPIGLSFDLLRAGMDFLPPPEVVEVEEGAYVSHMVTCYLGFTGEGRRNDLDFLEEWNDLNDDVSSGDLGYACVQNILEGGIDALGILPVDVGGILKNLADAGDDDLVNLVADITGAALEASVNADTWSTDDYLTLLYRFVTDASTIILESGVRDGAESVGDILLPYLNFFGRVSNAAKTGARIGTMARVTPLERHAIIAGDPWADDSSAPTITSFEATPSSMTEGSSSTLSWSVEGNEPITLSIDNEVGDVTTSSSTSVSPTATTTYTLTATNAAGSDTRTALVNVSDESDPDPTPTIDIHPAAVGLEPNATQAFEASVTGTNDTSVTWSATCGELTGLGLVVSYVAPGAESHCEITVALAGAPAISATATVEVVASDDPDPGVWELQFGTKGRDWIGHVDTNGSGIVAVGGAIGDALYGEHGGSVDIFVAMYDSDRELVWADQFGSEEWDDIRGLSFVGTDNFVIAGETLSTVLDPDAPTEEPTHFVRMYDALGQVVWTVSLPDPIVGLDANEQGQIVVGSRTANGGHVTMFDDLGEPIWSDETLGISDVAVNALGSVASTGNVTPDDSIYTDAVVELRDESGVLLWQDTYGTQNEDTGIAVGIDDNSNVYAAGTYNFTYGGERIATNTVFLQKRSPDGEQAWTRFFETTGQPLVQVLYDLSVDGRGRPVTAGITDGSISGSPSGSNDAFARGYETDGRVRFNHRVGSSGYDTGMAITSTSEGTIVLGGGVQGELYAQVEGESDAFAVEFFPDAVP